MNKRATEIKSTWKLFVIFVKKKIKDNYTKDKKFCKVRNHCHYTGAYGGVAHSICNLKYSVPKKIPIAFHNGSSYDYLIELAEESEKQFTCLGKTLKKT